MATTQRPKHATQRMSSGKDILSRMLQMEKQSKHQRASSISPTLPLSPRADCVSGSTPSPARSPKMTSAPPQSPRRPSHISRSQTSPALDSAVPLAEKPQPVAKTTPLTVSTDIAREEKPAEICLSPSWSDHGEKARKKEKRKAEREQRERDKKLRQEEERQKATDVKAGKRLSKKQPPAAMETQKMPTSLRRNSWISFMPAQSSSSENSRRSSRDEKRLSGMSFGSARSKRSQSTPGTSTKSAPATAGTSGPSQPIVSSSAPKLPSFRFSSSRKALFDQAKSASTGTEDTCEKDLIAFAYRLETSSIMNEPENIDLQKSKEGSTGETPSKPAATVQTNTEVNFMSIPYESVSSDSPQASPVGKSDKRESRAAKRRAKSQSGQSSPGLAMNGGLPSPHATAQSQTKPSYDGSSYVHKQRMYQQQQSIAGFEDQQAIEDATEAASKLAAEGENHAQVPKSTSERAQSPQTIKATATHGGDASVSSVYTKQRDRTPSPHVETAPAKHQPVHPTSLSQVTKPLPETPVQKHRTALQNAEKSMSVSNNQVTANHKTDRILGFRRRTKQSPALISIPYNAENQVVAVQSAPPDVAPSEEPGVKRSKIERLFREPKPAFANRDRRSSSSPSRDCVKDPTPEIKPKQSHSRTRTASSAALNSDLASPLRKSKTEPALDKAKKPVEHAPRTKSDYGEQEKSQSSAKNSPLKSHSRQSSAVIESDPKSKPNPDAKLPTKAAASGEFTLDDTHKSKVGKKQAHEVIVESETGEDLIWKTSIKRPRSNPQLQTPATASSPPPALDFLPPLKHQPLVKRERQSPTRTASTDQGTISISQFQEPLAALAYESPNPPDLKLIPRSPLRPPSQFPAANRFNRSATEVSNPSSFGKGTLTSGVDAKPLAKLFVICCKCKFWHDLPSKLYEAMALPLELHKAEKGKVAGARLETAVKCPWCEHGMTTSCCQGWTTVVYMHERHH